MKFGYKGAENNDLIEHFESIDNKIIIYFLDGSKLEIPLTLDNEHNLLNKMLVQAHNRANSSALADAQERRKNALKWIIIHSINTTFDLITVNISAVQSTKVFASIIGTITGLLLVIFGKEYKFRKEEIAELEKYDIYLSIIEKIEQVLNNEVVFADIKFSFSELNINTLDNYSLEEIKIIRNNLIKLEQYSSYFTSEKEDNVEIEKNNEEKSAVKKLSNASMN